MSQLSKKLEDLREEFDQDNLVILTVSLEDEQKSRIVWAKKKGDLMEFEIVFDLCLKLLHQLNRLMVKQIMTVKNKD